MSRRMKNEAPPTFPVDPTLEALYRQDEFPPEMLERGWTATPADWNPPPELQERVMKSFEAGFSGKGQARRPGGPAIWLALPLAVTAAGLAVTLVVQSAATEPPVLVLTASYPVPGPAQAIAGAAPERPAQRKKADHRSAPLPVMRGEPDAPASGPAGLDCIRLSPGRLRLFVDDVEAAQSAPAESGTAFWVSAGESGAFVATLFPQPGAGPGFAGWLEGDCLQFEHDGILYRIECERPLTNGGRKFKVWVRLHAGSNSSLGLGCAETPEAATRRFLEPQD